MKRLNASAFIMAAAAAVVGAACVLASVSCSATAHFGAFAARPPDAIGQAMAAGEYREAIELLKTAYARDPGSKKLVTRYVRSVEEIKGAADGARRRGDYDQAIGDCRILLDNWAGFAKFADRLTFGKGDVQTELRACRVGACAGLARREIDAGSYGKALAVYQAGLKDYPGDAEMKANFAAVVRELKAAGEKALAERDYALAGKIDTQLIDNLALLERQGVSSGLTMKSLSAAVQRCVVTLKNRGLQEYRKGNLENAIAVWDSLLIFDPDNTEIKKAVVTAKAQMGKLKSMGSRPRGGPIR